MRLLHQRVIMNAKALLDRNPKPTDQQTKEALAGSLCRCGTHLRIVRAVKPLAAHC